MDFNDIDELTHKVIGLAIKIHKKLGPGLLESVYQAALEWELGMAKISFEREKSIPVIYENVKLNIGFRCDFFINNQLILECKAVKELTPIDQAQVITYARLSGAEAALLINFHSIILKDGVKRLFPHPK